MNTNALTESFDVFMVRMKQFRNAVLSATPPDLLVSARTFGQMFERLMAMEAELQELRALATKTLPQANLRLMIQQGRRDEPPTQEDVLAEARFRMGHIKPSPMLIGEAFVYGDHASFRVKDAVDSADEEGFTLLPELGWGHLETVAKVLMLHITNRFGVTADRMVDLDGRTLMVKFDRTLTAPETAALRLYLGQ